MSLDVRGHRGAQESWNTKGREEEQEGVGQNGGQGLEAQGRKLGQNSWPLPAQSTGILSHWTSYPVALRQLKQKQVRFTFYYFPNGRFTYLYFL